MLSACRSTAETGPFSPETSVHANSFRALAEAAAAGDDLVGRRILARLTLLPLTEEERARCVAFERIFDGRDLVRGLDLRLVVREEGEQYLLLLSAFHPGDEPLELVLPPATLRRTTTSCYLEPAGDELRGSDTKRMESHASTGDVTLALPPREVASVELLRFRLEVGGAFAVRDHWVLALRSGEIRRGDDRFPAHRPDVRGVEVVRRADWLPSARVEPEELISHASRPDASEAGLLERAVRIHSSRRAETLRGLRGIADGLDESGMRRLVPALRWLSGSVKPGADPRAWRRWLRGERAEGEGGALDLPTVTRSGASP